MKGEEQVSSSRPIGQWKPIVEPVFQVQASQK